MLYNLTVTQIYWTLLEDFLEKMGLKYAFVELATLRQMSKQKWLTEPYEICYDTWLGINLNSVIGYNPMLSLNIIISRIALHY